MIARPHVGTRVASYIVAGKDVNECETRSSATVFKSSAYESTHPMARSKVRSDYDADLDGVFTIQTNDGRFNWLLDNDDIEYLK